MNREEFGRKLLLSNRGVLPEFPGGIEENNEEYRLG
jgi:hypothetical protein